MKALVNISEKLGLCAPYRANVELQMLKKREWVNIFCTCRKRKLLSLNCRITRGINFSADLRNVNLEKQSSINLVMENQCKDSVCLTSGTRLFSAPNLCHFPLTQQVIPNRLDINSSAFLQPNGRYRSLLLAITQTQEVVYSRIQSMLLTLWRRTQASTIWKVYYDRFYPFLFEPTFFLHLYLIFLFFSKSKQCNASLS